MPASSGDELLELSGVLQDGAPYAFQITGELEPLVSSEHTRLIVLPLGPTGTPVVLKLPTDQGAPDTTRLRREVMFAQRIGDAGSAQPTGLFLPPVPYVGAGLEELPHVFTEWVVGRTSLRIASIEHGVGSLAHEGALVQWLAALVERVVALHELGIVHRDLKPGNVLVTVRDGGIEPKSAWMIDLGHAALFTELPEEALTSDGHVVGTPGWMSPEQASGHEPDPCFDVFNLALLCLWVACGGTESQIFPLANGRRLHGKLSELRTSVQDIHSYSLRELLLAMLDGKENRPTSAQVADGLAAMTGTRRSSVRRGSELRESPDAIEGTTSHTEGNTWPGPDDWQEAAASYDRLAMRPNEARSQESKPEFPPDRTVRPWNRASNLVLFAAVVVAVIALMILRGAV